MLSERFRAEHFGDVIEVEEAGAEAGAETGVVGVSDQDQSTPGLSMRFIVSPPFTGYSFRSLPSTSAFPRRSKRCASAGGARGFEASCVLIEAMVSVKGTVSANECAGFATLKTRSIESNQRRQP